MSLNDVGAGDQDGPTPVPADDVDVMEPLLAPVASLTSGTSSAALPLLCETDQQREQRRRRREWVRPGYWQSYAFMAAWLAALLSGYAVQRAACQVGLPYDGLQQISFFELYADVSSIALHGAVLGWFVGVTSPRRFRWLFNWRRWYAAAVFLGTPPVYSAISNVDALKHDLAHLSTWGLPFILLWTTGMAAIAGVVGWHVWRVVGHRRWQDAAAYIWARTLIFIFFAGSALVLRRQRGVDFHLHHLYLGWSLALWAELNHPLSAITLAVGSGIFCQGVGAYSFAPVFQEECFTSPSGKAFECKFWADSPFSISICPATGPFPQHTCQ